MSIRHLVRILKHSTAIDEKINYDWIENWLRNIWWEGLLYIFNGQLMFHVETVQKACNWTILIYVLTEKKMCNQFYFLMYEIYKTNFLVWWLW